MDNTTENKKRAGVIGTAAENIIFVVISVILIGLLVMSVGIKGIKSWLTSPFTWDCPEGFEIELINMEQDGPDEDIELLLMISNATEYEIKECWIFPIFNGMRLERESLETIYYIEPGDAVTAELLYTEFSDPEVYELLKGKSLEEIEFEYQIDKLIPTDGGDLVHNNGWMKVGIIFGIGIICTVLLLLIPTTLTPVRIILKLCCLPMLVLLLLLICAIVFLLAIGKQKHEDELAAQRAQQENKPRGYSGIFK